ncbi:hypothetical protein DV737_g3908, partial [Chaetothyriales sp. CBS 132003]
MASKTGGGNAAFHNFHNDFAHIQDPNERRRLALAEIDKAPFGWYHVRAIVVAGIGFFTDAYDIFAINFVTSMLGVVYWQDSGSGTIPSSSDTAIKVATSGGTVLGQLGFGWLADVVGRKRMYGLELILIIFATLAQALASDSPSISIVGVIIFWRVLMGIGIGGDYPLSSIITSEFATTKWRGAMMGAVFAMQGIGQFVAAIIALIVAEGFKESLQTAASASECAGVCQLAVDKMWRVIIGFGAVPGCVALYFRLTIPETPRYTFDVARDSEKAVADVEAYKSGQHEGSPDEVSRAAVLQDSRQRLDPPKASWADFWRHYSQWKHGKVLLGTAGSWFFLDVAFYGLGLNNSIILQTIGFSKGSDMHQVFRRSAIGNLILVCAGAIPGYWITVATVDTVGRKPIQLMGFSLLTIFFIIIGFAYHKLSEGGLLALYVLCQLFFNFGPNATTFIVPGECFPTRYRSTSHGISAASGKVGAIIAQTVFGPLRTKGTVTKTNTAPWLNHIMQIFALFMLCGCFTTLLIPETKRKTLEELAGEVPGTKNYDPESAGHQRDGLSTPTCACPDSLQLIVPAEPDVSAMFSTPLDDEQMPSPAIGASHLSIYLLTLVAAMTSPLTRPSAFLLSAILAITVIVRPCLAHGGHSDKIPEDAAISADALDSRLWAHILLMVLAYGLIFPTGMVLGIAHSRWHVPVQIAGTAVAIPAYFLGHMHKGRQFKHPNIHASFANSLVLMTIVQVALGAGLKLHLEEGKGVIGRIFGGKSGRYGRRTIVIVHSWIGKLMPVVAWTQMVFGGIVALGFCRGDHTGQCLAHFIMGSAFIGYGIVMTILLLVGQAWLRRTGRSQEFFDSCIIAAWGCVNTFTEHRWGGPWVKNDLQHTSMGIVWWCAGLLGVWLSRSRRGSPRRNILPGLVIFLTGWGMSAHPQDLPISSMVHTVFGYTLMAAGATRIVEICFLLKDSRGGSEPSSFQHLPPFLLYASGFLFMSATEEQMQVLADNDVTHVSYILILFSIAFLLYLFVNILLHLYASYAWPDDETNGVATAKYGPSGGVSSGGADPRRHSRRVSSVRPEMGPRPGPGWHGRKASVINHVPYRDTEGSTSNIPNGLPRLPRHRVTDSQQVRDAEEFELEGLISEEEDENGDAPKGKGKNLVKDGDNV